MHNNLALSGLKVLEFADFIRGIIVNVSNAAGMEIIRRLVGWASRWAYLRPNIAGTSGSIYKLHNRDFCAIRTIHIGQVLHNQVLIQGYRESPIDGVDN